MNVTKVCFKCNLEKELNCFYKHKNMYDGHLNKCKDCTKNDSKKRQDELRKNPEWVEKEKERTREKYFRLGYKGKYKSTPKQRKLNTMKYFNIYPEKKEAKNKTSGLKAKTKGNQLHHWSYNEEHFKDVIELTVLEHNLVHRKTIYDQERRMYRRIDNNELLDTREKAEAYYNLIIVQEDVKRDNEEKNK